MFFFDFNVVTHDFANSCLSSFFRYQCNLYYTFTQRPSRLFFKHKTKCLASFKTLKKNNFVKMQIFKFRLMHQPEGTSNKVVKN